MNSSLLLAAPGLLGFAVSLLAQATSPNSPDSAAPFADLEAFVQREMARDQIPGLALAIVKDGEVVFSRGFGFRDVEKKLPVTPQTAFAIGSITKSFTVATLGALVQQGRLDWDRPVRDYLPDFQLYDAATTARITPRDLVTHRSGLPRHDWLWYHNDLSRQDYVRRLRYLEPSADLRARYQYNNLMFMTAGYLAGELGGTTWESLVKREILEPLGMTGTTTSITALQASPEPAVGYREDNRKAIIPMPYTNIDAIAPAGAINSNLEDMSRYVRMLLGGGRAHGRQIVAPRTVEEMMSPHTPITDPPIFPELGLSHYGMGLGVSAYRGHRHISHSGAIDGFIALMSLLPDDRLGVVVLTNLNQSRNIHPVVAYRIYDRLLGLGEIDWGARYAERKSRAAGAESAAKDLKVSPRKTGTQPAHPLGEYAGDYEHPAYGRVKIAQRGENIELSYRGTTTALRHYHYEVFEVPADRLNDFSREKVMFTTDINGDITSLALKLEPQVNDIIFARRADPAMSAPGFLAPLAGVYEIGTSKVTVALRGDKTLTLESPGAPLRELLPVTGTRFRLSGPSGYGAEFVRNREGVVTHLALYRPAGEVVGTRVSEPVAPSTQ